MKTLTLILAILHNCYLLRIFVEIGSVTQLTTLSKSIGFSFGRLQYILTLLPFTDQKNKKAQYLTYTFGNNSCISMFLRTAYVLLSPISSVFSPAKRSLSTILFDTIDKDIVRLVSCASVNIFLTVDTQQILVSQAK